MNTEKRLNNEKPVFDKKIALSDYKLSGSPLRKETAETNGCYPIENGESGTKLVYRFVFSKYFPEIINNKPIKAEKVIPILKEYRNGEKNIVLTKIISERLKKPYGNLKNLIGLLIDRYNKGLITAFKGKDLNNDYIIKSNI